MTESNQLLITSDASGMLWNMCFWDFSTGTSLKTIKVGVSAARTLAMISSEYVVSAEQGKPIINVWSVQKQQQQHIKMVSPGKISALTVTPDGTFCIGAVAEKLHVWQVSTGELLSVITHHYQPINCLKTTDDGSFFISAGEDNLVYVWKLQKRLNAVLSSRPHSADNAPHYSWTHHTLPVTDIHVGKGGRRARIATVSLDHSCRLYSLCTGELLITFMMEVSLSSVTMDLAEFQVFLGGSDGRVFQISLIEPSNMSEHHNSTEESNIFVGHSKAVTALAATIDCQTLISGSQDESVKVWNIPSRQCLRILNHKGPITNLALIPTFDVSSFTGSAKPQLNISPFRSYLCGTDNLEGTWEHSANIILPRNEKNNVGDIVKFAQELYEEETTLERNAVLRIEALEKSYDELYLKVADKILDND